MRGRHCSRDKDDYRQEKCSWIFATHDEDRKKKRHVVGGLFCKMTMSLSGEPLSWRSPEKVKKSLSYRGLFCKWDLIMWRASSFVWKPTMRLGISSIQVGGQIWVRGSVWGGGDVFVCVYTRVLLDLICRCHSVFVLRNVSSFGSFNKHNKPVSTRSSHQKPQIRSNIPIQQHTFENVIIYIYILIYIYMYIYMCVYINVSTAYVRKYYQT